MNQFKKKYTAEMVISAIQEYKITPRQIANHLGCGMLTVTKRLDVMLAGGQVSRINAGTDKKPVWIYSVVE